MQPRRERSRHGAVVCAVGLLGAVAYTRHVYVYVCRTLSAVRRAPCAVRRVLCAVRCCARLRTPGMPILSMIFSSWLSVDVPARAPTRTHKRLSAQAVTARASATTRWAAGGGHNQARQNARPPQGTGR